MKVDTPTHNKSSQVLEVIGWILLSTYIIVLPIGHTTALRNLLFFSLIAITVWLALRGRIRIYIPIIKPWLLYATVAFISLTYAVDPWYSLGEIKTEIGFGFMAMALGATWIRTSEQFSRLAWAIIACNTFLVAGSIFFAYQAYTQGSPLTSIGSFNIGVGKLSTYIVLMLPFVTARWWLLSDQHQGTKYFLAILIVANIAALYFTGNRAGLAALFMETIVLATLLLKYRPPWLRRRKTWVWLALAMLLFGALEAQQIGNRDPLAPNISASMSTDPRWVVWNFAAQNIVDRPFSGGGFGLHAFKLRNPNYSTFSPNLWHAHNTLLNIGVQTGLPGIITFTILLLMALLKVSDSLIKIPKWDRSLIHSLTAVVMFSGLAVKLQTDDFFNRDIALFFWLLVGALSSRSPTTK